MNTKYDGDKKGSMKKRLVCFLKVTMTRPTIPTKFCQRVRPVKIARPRRGQNARSNRGLSRNLAL